MPAADSTAFDPSSRTIWTVVAQPSGNSILLGFHVNTAQLQTVPTSPCISLQVAAVNGSLTLVCFASTASQFVMVDMHTGATKPLQAPSLSAPVQATSAIRWNADKSSSSYFVQMSDGFTQPWLEIDVATGKTVTNSYLDSSITLTAPVYVSK